MPERLDKRRTCIVLVVNTVKGLLQINNDYTIRKASIDIDTQAIVCLQCWPLFNKPFSFIDVWSWITFWEIWSTVGITDIGR